MNKIIIIITPVEGHFNPFIPIMIKLVEKGHQVVCITGRIFKDQVENIGASFIPVPGKWDPGENEVYDFFPELKKKKSLSQFKYYLKHIMLDSVQDALNMLNKVLGNFPADIVISDSFMIAGSWITQLGGPPNVRLSVVPLNLPGKNIAPFGLGILPGETFLSKLKNNILRKIFNIILYRDIHNYINEIRKNIGLPIFEENFQIIGLESSNLFLHASIPAFEYPRNTFPSNLHFIGPILVSPQKIYKPPEWWPEIEKNAPVILINQGTVEKNYENLILPSIEALEDENMILIAVPVKDGKLVNLPKNVHTELYIPFGNILPHVDLMITNGGFGGTQNALSHGIPVIIAGATEDKMEVAARLEYSGAGINLGKQKPSPSNIKKAVMKIFSDPSYKQRAIELQSEFAKYDAPNLAVELIEELIEKTKK